jgi:glucokinase-like ROK family protein
MRRLNRSAILNLIRSESPVARTEIAGRLGMSLPTVMRSVDELMEEGLVYFKGSAPSGGRRRPLLWFNGSAHSVVAVDLGGSKMRAMVVDLTGHVQHERLIPVRRTNTPSRTLEDLYTLIQEMLDAPHPDGQTVRGIAIGAPGVTLANSGTIVWAPSLGWRDFPLRDLLGDRFKLPVFVENDVNLAALGEYGFGVAAGASNLICIAIGTGIGAGILLEGKLYRGHNQASGEVGYVLPGLDCLGRRYDEFGALEDFASGRGIAMRAQAYLAKHSHDSSLNADDVTAEDVFALARDGAAWAKDIIDQTVDHLALMLASVSALLDPEVIVLSGGVSRSEDLLVGPIKARLDGLVPYVPNIVASNLGSQAVAMGAVMLVLDATTGHVMIDQRI